MLWGFLEGGLRAGALAGNLKLGNPVGKRAHGRGQGGRRGGRLAIRSSRFPKGHRRQRRRVTHGKCVGPCGHIYDGGARLPARSGPRWRLGGRARCPLRAGGDGRLQSRRPGAGTMEKVAFPRFFAQQSVAPRLRLGEAARAASGGRHEVTDPSSWPCDRRSCETAGAIAPDGRRSYAGLRGAAAGRGSASARTEGSSLSSCLCVLAFYRLPWPATTQITADYEALLVSPLRVLRVFVSSWFKL